MDVREAVEGGMWSQACPHVNRDNLTEEQTVNSGPCWSSAGCLGCVPVVLL